MKQILDEFIKYAKEQFGYEISVEKTSTPDSFESIFGVNFFEQDSVLWLPEGEEIRFEYVNQDICIPLDFSNVMAENCLAQEIGLAA